MAFIRPIIKGGGTDISDTTAIATDVLASKDFYLANGTKTTGTIPTYAGSTEITENATLETEGKYLASDIVVNVSGGGSQPTDGPWVRPADRLTKPTIADNEVYWLFGVSENSPNDFAVIGVSDGTDYTIEWGDGTSSVVANNAIAEKQFDYSSAYFQGLTADSRGYKQVWIKMRPTSVGENIKTVNINTRPSWRPSATAHIFEPQVLEFYIRASGLTSLVFGTSTNVYNRYTMCDVFGLQENSLSSCNYMLIWFIALQKIDDLDINNISNMTYFMSYCFAYNQPFPSNVTFANVTANFMNYCYAYNQPFPSNVTFAKVIGSFMNSCYAYNQPLTVTFSLTNSHTHSGFIGSTNYAMKYLRVVNWNAAFESISIQNGSYSADSLALLFTDLYDRTATTAGAINITNCYGASLLTAGQKQIATDKNWVITGA